MEKIVITGMGAITPIGNSVDRYWENLLQGVCGIGPITRFDVSELPVRIAAEVRDFDPTVWMPKKLAGEMDLFMQYAYAAAEQALADSQLPIEPGRTGVVMGTALDGLTEIGRVQEALTAEGKRVGPRFLPKILGNLAAAQIAIAHQITGPTMTVNTACSSGADAIILAAMLLKTGEADSVLVMGGESTINPLMIGSLSKAMALSRRNDDPQAASRPFDVDRDGFVMGEGGGAIVLELASHAKARGAKIYAELAGYANTSDAYHVTAPNPSGAGAAQCMERAIAMAGLDKSEIGYINAHGTSTHAGDIAETNAIKLVFGGREHAPAVSSTKGATGHLMGAGGVTEAITCVLAIQNGILPPTLNLQSPDPECDLDYVPNAPRSCSIHAAMSNAFGFGGQNSSLVIRAWNDE
jgi:3-oxoacyl-[acyl-carrier-protein] synthase II